MRTRRSLFAFVFLAVLAPALTGGTLILYDGKRGESEAFKSARYVRNLLEHFSLENVRVIHAADYRPGEAADADFIFAAFEEDRPVVTGPFLADLAAFRGPIVWLNMHIERLLEASGRTLGLVHEGFSESRAWKVFCRGIEFAKDDPWINVVRLADGANGTVLAEAVDESGRRFPYAVRSGNLWYFVDSPFAFAVEGGRFLILAELLHDIIGQPHERSRRALVRIEDVNPESDPFPLKRIADYLAREGVPFQVSLIPIHKDPDAQTEVPLSERPAVVEALAHMVSKGGTVVLHGVTHQHRGRSGVDYEFWDDIAGTPLRQTDGEWTDRRIRQGLEECFRCGIHPLAWETPHYSASPSDYRTFAKYFDTFYDRVMSAELAGTQQPLPYPVRLREYGVTVVPENLGYVDIGAPDPAAVLLAAERTSVVRDGVASFFFHPFVPLKHLKAIVSGMKKTGWEFISLRDFPCQLRTESRWVTSAGGEGRIALANQYTHTLRLDRKGKVVSEDFASARRMGIETRRITLGGGGLFVLEGLDVLPAPKRKTWWPRLSGLFGSGSKKAGRRGILNISRALILAGGNASPEEENDQKSFFSVLNVFGLNPDTRSAEEAVRLPLGNYNLVVVPQAAARSMKRPEINAVWDYVSGGGSLVIDGPSPLAAALGLRFGADRIEVREVKELILPSQSWRWNPPAVLHPLAAENLTVLAKDASGEAALAGVRTLSEGRILCLATLFDPSTVYGISRFPYLPFYLRDALKVSFNVRRDTLEFYFDPGLRANTSLEKLAARWKASGVKIIYLAAWHFYESYRFDYDYFIRLCHDHGIAVYAWFEFPQVSPLFWEAHPEWREKTATGKDALCHWRFQMNLYRREPREAALTFFRELLMAHDWDGVNLAELNFDTNQGAADPDKFTPMNSDVREAFRGKEGFDPAELFSPASAHFWKRDRAALESFLRFRGSIILDLHKAFLDEAERVKKAKAKDMEIIVTAMDSLLHPEIFEDCGIDTRDIIGLMDRYPFTLQVEDPSRSWTRSPSRYLEYYEAYKALVGDERRLMFDVNCLANRDIRGTVLPSAQATGTELAATIFYASLPSGRVGIYAESTVQPFDLDLLAFVLGADVAVVESAGGYEVEAKRPFTLPLAGEGVLPYIGKEPWPFVGARGISSPSGTYRLEFGKAGLLDNPFLSPQIAFDGDFADLERTTNSFKLKYRSPLPVSMTFNRALEAVLLDAADITPASNRTGIILPRGEHVLEIITERTSDRTVRVAGYMTSSALSILGMASALLLLGVYLQSKLSGRRNP